MGIGLVLFWPALFFLEGGDGPQALRYQQLKGEAVVLERVGTEKKCGGISKPEAQVVMTVPSTTQATEVRIPLVERELTQIEKTIYGMAEDCDTYHGAGGIGCQSQTREHELRETELYNRCMGTKSGSELSQNCQAFAVANTKAFKDYVRKQLRTTKKLPLPANSVALSLAGS